MVADTAVDRMDIDPTPLTGDQDDKGEEDNRSLRIPITSSSATNEEEPLFVEIFPDEMSRIPVAKLLQVLRDEKADFPTWSDAGLFYMQQKQARQALAVLEEACDLTAITEKSDKVHILAATGIAHLAASNLATGSGGINSLSSKSSKRTDDPKTELRQRADEKFTKASKMDTFFPMTWIGRGMLNLEKRQFDQARFFFQTTEKQCGPVLPALLGMAAVLFAEGDYQGALAKYSTAIRQYPENSGAPARVGFGLACYKMGQIDRAKAAFKRALEMDPENVEAMVSTAVLDMASLDHTSSGEFASQTEKAIKLMSMANLLDHSNAMVQNHLANHYFWKWTQETNGTVSVTQGSDIISVHYLTLEPGERIRIGAQFETTVDDEVDNEDDNNEVTKYKIKHIWKSESGSSLKVWKKDYDRVIALAKGAYSSTMVESMRAESLFFLARVYHVRQDYDNAHRFYKQACKLSSESGGDESSLTPARFGLAQTFIVQKDYEQAISHLRLVLKMSPQATDALALLGLLLVHNPKTLQDGLVQLQKAIELDPLNPHLVVLEAVALQQHEANYSRALERYKKAIQLMKAKHLSMIKGKSRRKQQVPPPDFAEKIPYDIYANCGVLCHKTNQFDESLQMYILALEALVATTSTSNGEGRSYFKIATLDNKGTPGGRIRQKDNHMFHDYLDTNIKVVQKQVQPAAEPDSVVVEEEAPSQKKLWIIQDKLDNIQDLIIEVGDHVRLGQDFESEIVDISASDEGVQLELKDQYTVPDKDQDPKDDTEGEKTPTQAVEFSLWVKRENKILKVPKALTIAFNIARLHEAAGRPLAAIELHKAILKRNPAYVNSLLCLACIAVDCGALPESSKWLKLAAQTAPGNPEVLNLVGNLHLSLADWQPAQKVFDSLLVKKVTNVEAYASLSLGNIYFATLHMSEKRYAKHLQYASDYYKRILTKDPANAYAGNGLGTVLAEKAEMFKAKEVFNRVREVSGDTIADTLVNLGHIYLAQKKHPEALQMYKSYMKRAEDGTTPITSKSRVDDVVDVLMYIAFSYFDWARHTELSNDSNAAPADGRYLEAMNYLELAISKHSKRDMVLKYNLCMTRLQAANCILQKLTRNIPRTVEEVEGALDGLKESFEVVQSILKEKTEGAKVQISTSKLQDFLKHCRANISSAESHLEDEKKRAEDAETEKEIRRLAAEAALKEEEIKKALEKEKETREQEERDRKAEAKMKFVEELKVGWKQEQAREVEKKVAKKKTGQLDDFIEDDNANVGNEEEAVPGSHLFDESDDENDNGNETQGKAEGSKNGDDEQKETRKENDIFGDSDDEGDADGDGEAKEEDKPASASKPDLFGDSSENDESDEELLGPSKRTGEDIGDGDSQPAKKRRVLEEDDDA